MNIKRPNRPITEVREVVTTTPPPRAPAKAAERSIEEGHVEVERTGDLVVLELSPEVATRLAKAIYQLNLSKHGFSDLVSGLSHALAISSDDLDTGFLEVHPTGKSHVIVRDLTSSEILYEKAPRP